MPAPETIIDITSKLASYVTHEESCPAASDYAATCDCGLYDVLKRAANLCQIAEAEAMAMDARADAARERVERPRLGGLSRLIVETCGEGHPLLRLVRGGRA